MTLLKYTMRKNTYKKIFRIVLWIGIVIFTSVLMMYMFKGIFSRYWADDYCFSALAKNYGLWGGLKEHYFTWSNRYTAYLLSVMWDWLGVTSVQLYPAVMIFLLGAGLTWNVKLILQKLNLSNSILISFLIGEIAAFFILYEAPNLFQSLYWRSGMVSYFAPLVFFAFINVLILIQHGKQQGSLKLKWFFAILTAVVVFFAIGTSETFAALLCGYLLLLGIYLWVKNLSIKKIPPFFSLLLLAAIMGGLIIVLSPGNQVRMQSLHQADSIFTFLWLSFKNGLILMIQSVSGSILPNTMIFLIQSILFYNLSEKNIRTYNPKNMLLLILLLLICAFFLLVCICAPTVYSMMAFPEPRALILGRAVVIFMIMGLGVLSGLASHRYMERVTGTRLASIILLALLVTVYPLRALLLTWNTIPIAQERAKVWDARKELIEKAIVEGKDHLDLTPVNSVNGIYEITEDPAFWVNSCASDFYGIKSLRAIDKP